MSDLEELLRGVAEVINDGVEEEDIVLYDYVLGKLRESGLLRLLEAGQACAGYATKKWSAEWDAALVEMKEKVNR